MKVNAFKINKTHIFIKCPICKSKYKKNGLPYKNAKPLTHLFGSSGNLHYRTEHRGNYGHCVVKHPDDFNIIINENTLNAVN